MVEIAGGVNSISLRGSPSRDHLVSRAQAAAEMLAAKPPVAMALNLSFFRDLLRARLSEAEEKAAVYQSEAIATGEPQVAMQQFLAARDARVTKTPD